MDRKSLGATEELTLKNKKGVIKLTLLGSHLLSYTPEGGQELFWMGSRNTFEAGKAIRGGIPICWPRFGDENLNNAFAKHGFARNQEWIITNLEEGDEKTVITLTMQQALEYKELQEIEAMLHLTITLTDSLELELETLNIGDKSLAFSEALHSYFSIGDIDKLTLKGLDGQHYIDKTDGSQDKIHKGDLTINQWVDWVFYNHLGTLELVDPVFKRMITIEKNGSHSTIVWNPYQKAIADEVLDTDYKNFICVEAGNVATDHRILASGERHKLTMKISCKAL